MGGREGREGCNAQEGGRYAAHIQNSHETAEESADIAERGRPGQALSNDVDSFEYVRKHLSNNREGFFKLECSSNLSERCVLDLSQT